MKKILLTILAVFLALGFSACETDADGGDNLTPVARDYEIIGNLFQTLGSTTPVSVVPKAGSSPGNVTVYYTGISGTNYAANTALPAIAGVFSVTFNVAAASGWNAVNGLAAGNLTISSGGSGAELFPIQVLEIQRLLLEAALQDPTTFATLSTYASVFGLTLTSPSDARTLPASIINLIPGVQITATSTLNSLINTFASDYDYEKLSYESDIKLYSDEEGEYEFTGEEIITSETMLYSTLPLELIAKVITGGERFPFTVNDLLAKFDLTDSDLTPNMTLDDLILLLSDGELGYEALNIQGVSFYTAETGGGMDKDSVITGGDMVLWSTWAEDLSDIASMF